MATEENKNSEPVRLSDAVEQLLDQGIGAPGQDQAMEQARLTNRLGREDELAKAARERRANAYETLSDPELLQQLGREALEATASAEETRQKLGETE